MPQILNKQKKHNTKVSLIPNKLISFRRFCFSMENSTYEQ